MFEWILKKLEERIKLWMTESYLVGYENGRTDTSRHMHQLYDYGYKNGKADALAEIPEIDTKTFRELEMLCKEKTS